MSRTIRASGRHGERNGRDGEFPFKKILTNTDWGEYNKKTRRLTRAALRVTADYDEFDAYDYYRNWTD